MPFSSKDGDFLHTSSCLSSKLDGQASLSLNPPLSFAFTSVFLCTSKRIMAKGSRLTGRKYSLSSLSSSFFVLLKNPHHCHMLRLSHPAPTSSPPRTTDSTTHLFKASIFSRFLTISLCI